MRLKGKVIIVTGGAGGFGRAIGMRCAQEGADLVLADINFEGAKKTALEVEKIGRRALPLRVDVRKKKQVQHMIDQAVKTFNKVDVLVNNAGVFTMIPFLELSEKEWDRMIDTNLKGSFLCSQAVIAHMVEKKILGSLIHISSLSAFVAFPESAHYCSSKGALLQLSKVLALAFGPNGIRSNVITPGTCETQMTEVFLGTPEGREFSLKSIPLKRFGEPDDIAAAVVFLASDEASYFNGATLQVDGGAITHN
jgi:glucose 1-dehydrogenase